MLRENAPVVRRVVNAVGVVCAGGAALLAGAVPAVAEASDTTVTVGLTGMTDSSCTSVGGNKAFVAPGGTVRVEATALHGPSVELLDGETVDLDSDRVTSFDETVDVGDETYSLHSPGDSFTVSPTKEQAISWSADAVYIGVVRIPLRSDTVVPAGTKLSWSGTIVVSDTTDCGLAVAVPTVTASVGPVSVTAPGTAVSVPVPVPQRTTSHGAGGGHSAPAPQPSAHTSPPRPNAPTSGAGTPGAATTTAAARTTPSSGSRTAGATAASSGTAASSSATSGTRAPTTGATVGRINAAADGTTPAATSSGSSTAAAHRATGGGGGPGQLAQLGSTPGPGHQVPLVLALSAMVALAAVTLGYLRTRLLPPPPA